MEFRVGDFVRIIDPTVCGGGEACRNMHDTYVVTRRSEEAGCYIKNVRTGEYCGYLFNFRLEKIHRSVTCTRRLTVLREDKGTADE